MSYFINVTDFDKEELKIIWDNLSKEYSWSLNEFIRDRKADFKIDKAYKSWAFGLKHKVSGYSITGYCKLSYYESNNYKELNVYKLIPELLSSILIRDIKKIYGKRAIDND
jgi:hypothetical protein